MILLKMLVALVAACCSWLVSFWAASRLLRGAHISARSVAGLCLGYWLLGWSFQILALLRGFRLAVIVPLSAVLAIAVLYLYFRRRGVADELARSRGELAAELRSLRAELGKRRWVAAGLGIMGVHLVVRSARVIATPAFGWDDFTYHLYRAGRWVQNGGLQLEPAPDAWTYYEFFPWGGDLIWAWALVWRVSDVLVPLAAIVVWCTVLLAAYAVARELGQDSLTALIVALAVAVLPSQASLMSTAYVDNAVLAMVLVASLFLLVFEREASPDRSGEAQSGRSGAASFFVGAACGSGLLIKVSFLPLLAPAGAIVAWLSLRSRSWRGLGAFVCGMSVAFPNLVFRWLERGSPFYPFRIVEGLPYNEQWTWILGKYGQGSTPAELGRAAKALVINLFPLDPFLNVGWSGALLLLLGVLGSVRLLRSVRGRWFLLWALSGGVITMLSFFSPRNSSMIAWWTIVMGRFLVPSLAGLLVSSGLVGPLLVRRVLFPVLLVEYFVYARRRWPVDVTVATLQIVALIAAVAGLGLLLRRWKRHSAPVWAAMPVVVALCLLAAVGVRERIRYDAYRLFSERRMYDFHGVPYMEAWPIWQRVEETGPSRVAVTAGFDGLTGHNWFRWPLLGAWLQNEVVYLPVTTGGELVSYADPERLRAAGDRAAWLTRVSDQEIDRVAALGPATIEHQWILELPKIFPLEITMGNNHFLLARVDHEQLTRNLEESRSTVE